ncbi:hypothetical protein WDU94_007026 [Cyamophila willieti]
MTIRWFICIILVIGVLCVVIGCVLGTMNTGYRQHVSVSLLMIGVGIILVTVSGLAWRLSVYRDESTPTWRMLLGLGGNHSNTGEEGSGEPNRRFVPRLPPSYGRPHHPYAGEFCGFLSFSERFIFIQVTYYHFYFPYPIHKERGYMESIYCKRLKFDLYLD